jgi:hypothetical protein
MGALLGLSPLQILRASNISAWWKKQDTTGARGTFEVLELATNTRIYRMLTNKLNVKSL